MSVLLSRAQGVCSCCVHGPWEYVFVDVLAFSKSLVISSLMRLDVSQNYLDRGGNGVQLLRDAVREREGFVLIDDDND